MLTSFGLHTDVTLSNVDQSLCSMPQAYTFPGACPVEHAHTDVGSGKSALGSQVDMGLQESRCMNIHDCCCTHDTAPSGRESSEHRSYLLHSVTVRVLIHIIESAVHWKGQSCPVRPHLRPAQAA